MADEKKKETITDLNSISKVISDIVEEIAAGDAYLIISKDESVVSITVNAAQYMSMYNRLAALHLQISLLKIIETGEGGETLNLEDVAAHE